MANVLIYGGSGIISTEITKRAIMLGHSITIVNRGRRSSFIHPKASCIIADLRNEPLEQLKKKISENYDTIIDFLSYTRAELIRNMELAKGHCNQYIFISTAVAYQTKEGRYCENDPIGNPEWDYSLNKTECEQYLREHAAEHGFEYTIIRPYITYGQTRIPLQFGPIEYYTIVNRMKCGKCIPVFGSNVACTLTSSKDFAVAAVGLIQEQRAFSEAFHITGSYETTWDHVLQIVAEAFKVQYEAVQVPEKIFKNHSLSYGLNVAEVIGDKGRNMLFDNFKIRSVVPEFSGDIKLEDEIESIVWYFENNESAREVNYSWDARVDRLLAKSGILSKEQKRKLHYNAYNQRKNFNLLKYTFNRYKVPYLIARILKN